MNNVNKMAINEDNACETNPSYETQESVNRYLLRYWGQEDEIWSSTYKSQFNKPEVTDLAQYYVDLITKHTNNFGRAIDIGCAAGRASFELARSFEEVIGIDYSHALIDAANILKDTGEHEYSRKILGSEIYAA